jgi:hypothetical protein
MNAYETALALVVMAKAGEDGTVDSQAALDGFEQDSLPKTGYYVGGVRPSLIVSSPTDLDRGEVAWFVGGTDARYFGVWTDSETGMIYVDAVEHLDDAAAAISLALSRDEIAVWDIENGTELRVKGEGSTQWELDERNKLNP